jgi:hypothetical protein
MRALYSPHSHVIAAHTACQQQTRTHTRARAIESAPARAVGTAIVSSSRASCRITPSFSAAAGVLRDARRHHTRQRNNAHGTCSSRLSTITDSATTLSDRLESSRISDAMQLSVTVGMRTAHYKYCVTGTQRTAHTHAHTHKQLHSES